MRRPTLMTVGVLLLALTACGADDDQPLEIEEPTQEPDEPDTDDPDTDDPAPDDEEADDREPEATEDDRTTGEDAADDPGGSDEEDPVEPGDQPERLQPDERAGSATPPRGIASDLDTEVEAAIDDLASRTGTDPSDVEVVAAQHVTWPDGSIGCPEPGQMYTMALVEGYRIVLDHDGEQVHYHGEEGGEPFHCADPSEPSGSDRPTS